MSAQPSFKTSSKVPSPLPAAARKPSVRPPHSALSVARGWGAAPKDFAWIRANIPCQAACPAGTDIPGYLEAIARGDYAAAYRINLEDNVFPAVLGRVCVFGNGPLPAAPILGATYLEPGTPFSLAALEEAQRAIYALGTLSSVEIRHRTPEDAPDTHTEETEESGLLAATDTSQYIPMRFPPVAQKKWLMPANNAGPAQV